MNRDEMEFEAWAKPHREYWNSYHHDIGEDCREAFKAGFLAGIKHAEDEARKRAIDYVCDKKGW